MFVVIFLCFFLVPRKLVPSGYSDTYLMFSRFNGEDYSVTQEQGKEIIELLKDYRMQGSLTNPFFSNRDKTDIDLVFTFQDAAGVTRETRRISIAHSENKIEAYLSYNPIKSILLRANGKVLNASELYEKILKIIEQ